MENYTLTETYKLPSGGSIYPKGMVAPEITIRSMKTAEEMRRLSPSTSPYKHMCDILDSCIVSDIGMSSYDMCLGDYLFLLHKLRVVTYGSQYQMSTVCPLCLQKEITTIDLDKLTVNTYNKEHIEHYKHFQLPVTKKWITLKLETPRMLDAIADNVKDMKERNPDADFDNTLVATMEQIIDTIDGKVPDFIALPDWLRELPMLDTQTILQYADKLNSSIGIDPIVKVTCNNCTLEYDTQFKTTSEFFRPALVI